MIPLDKSRRHHRSRVLVVDDDPIFLRLATTRLEKAVHGATQAQDGMEAWHLLKGGGYDLALIDLEMPNMNGFALMRCIRTYPATQQMPLIVVSTHDDIATVQRAFQAGATGFLTKPLNWSMFLPYIEHLLALVRATDDARTQAQELGAQADARSAIAEALTTELRSRARRIAAAAKRALPETGEVTDSTEMARALEVALNEANAQRRAVEALAPYSELIGQATSSRVGVHPLSPLVTSVKARCQVQAEQRNVDLSFSDVATIDVRCLREAFVTCLTDIVSHAIANAPEGSSVRVNVLLEGEEVAITVTDQGRPLSPHIAALLDDARKTKGTPLPPLSDLSAVGLLMAPSLARMIDARLELVRDGGAGNTIRLALPGVLVRHSEVFDQHASVAALV
jgi:CheY-like chemotaxis protein/anti-sigma regulatory factor (Ser/Thr protein kinase)